MPTSVGGNAPRYDDYGRPILPAPPQGATVVRQAPTDADLWYWYLAGQFETAPPPSSEPAPSSAPPDYGPPPHEEPPGFPNVNTEPGTPLYPPGYTPPGSVPDDTVDDFEPPPSSAPPTLPPPLPLTPPPGGPKYVSPPDYVLTGYSLGAVAPPYSSRAARDAQTAERVKQLEAESILTRGAVRPRAEPPSAFERLLKLPRAVKRTASRVTRTWPIVGEILGGELGVILPTVLFPDEARRQSDAAREAAVQKAIADAIMRGRWNTPTPARSATRSPAPRATPSGPPAPPSVPQLPGLTPRELSRVLGEPQPSAMPQPFSAFPPKSAAGRVRAKKRPPRIAQETRSPWTLGLPLPQFADFGSAPLGFAGPAASSPVPLPFSPPLAQPLPEPQPQPPSPSWPGGPDASVDTSARPLPQPLTSFQRDMLQSSRDCTCERPPPRPSDKVPTVRSYRRRMSQNSLDNLQRGHR